MQLSRILLISVEIFKKQIKIKKSKVTINDLNITSANTFDISGINKSTIKSIINTEIAGIVFEENGDILNFIKIKTNFIKLNITSETEDAKAAPIIPHIGIKIQLVKIV